ncbi:MAG: 30S ribosomal protein S12 methylthiotransferase RimO [Bacilli bacterium]|nr:30S ribosomal protein S12 methylthiotransferase RimO [Bacilli bacterium]
MKKIGLISLGCAKNLIDSEMILAMFKDGDYQYVDDPAKADLIIINTCGFIEPAKRESIETILQMAEYKGAKLLAVGCFVERNLPELKEALPEVDLWVPIRDYKNLNKRIEELLGTDDIKEINPLDRVISTPKYAAYLRISEGCNNFCSFCAIPYIRGRFKSRPYEEIIKEARSLKEKGVKEISIISQDTTNYGADFPNKRPNIYDLLKELDGMGFYSIRLLYLYPGEISDDLLYLVRDSKSIAHYLDIPIQCASNNLLRLMNRHDTKKDVVTLFRKIREIIPDAVLRTTLISGFPGETTRDQIETLKFIEDVKFDKLGDFTFSREEGTAAYNFKHQVRESTKNRRRDEIMTLQKKISYEKNKSHIGEVMEGLVIGYDRAHKSYMLRSYWNAPDDIDGAIYFSSDTPLNVGDIVKVKITNAFIYDLIGEKC